MDGIGFRKEITEKSVRCRHGPATVSGSLLAIMPLDVQTSGKAQADDDLESGELPIQQSPLSPARDRDGGLFMVFCCQMGFPYMREGSFLFKKHKRREYHEKDMEKGFGGCNGLYYGYGNFAIHKQCCL